MLTISNDYLNYFIQQDHFFLPLNGCWIKQFNLKIFIFILFAAKYQNAIDILQKLSVKYSPAVVSYLGYFYNRY